MSTIGRITGQMLFDNLERQGSNLAIDGNLVYADVTNRRVGISTASPQYSLDAPGNVRLANLTILGNVISSNTGKIGLGSISSLVITGGSSNQFITTDGNGNLSFATVDLSVINANVTAANIVIASLSANLGTTQSNIGVVYANLSTQQGNFNTLNANVGAYETWANANLVTQTTNFNTLNANVGVLYSGNISTQANLGAYQTWANLNYATSLGPTNYYAWANANLATQTTNFNTLNANVGVLYSGNISTQANLGAYQTWANGNAASQATLISNLQSNTGAYYFWANANLAQQATNANTLTTNVSAYYTWANANLATQTTNLSLYQTWANANLATQATNFNTLNANVGAYETWANANLATQASSITTLTTNLSAIKGNTISLGSNTGGVLVSNAVTLTTGTTVTDSIAQLNLVLGKLVPQSPPAFPGTTPLTLTTATTSARITNFTQIDNSLGNTYQATAGTTVAAIRTATYTTSNLTAIGPGDSGTVTVYWNGKPAGANTLVAGGNVITSNLVIGNNMDYNKVLSTVAANFWQSFNTYATGTSLPGWNTVWIGDSSNSANTNPVLFYYDSTTVAGPTWSNATTAGTNAVLTSNVVAYSSTVPHLTSGSTLRLKGNVANLSGDMYYTSDTFITGTTGGAWQAPTSVAYSGLNPAPATPLIQNLYKSSGSAYLETPASLITTGFGSSSIGPSLTAFNGYGSTAQAFTTALGVTVLYKNGTTTQIEETSIPVNSVGTGSGNGFRIVNPGSTNNPAYTGSEAAFNSQTSALTTTDATNVAAAAAGVLKYDVTDYSTGYYPVGPNLSSGRGATQYFTFKFVRTAVSKFDIKYTGTIAGLWVALPGLTESANYGSTNNGWYDVSNAYFGTGIPGTGSLANGSFGCAVGGSAILNVAQTNLSITATFGTLSSTNSTGNEIYVRVAFTSGQSLTALTAEVATH